jgi:hypothetical protein
VIATIALLAGGACARTLERPIRLPTPAEMSVLWQEPHDLERRDLLHGAGGADRRPASKVYTFVSHKTSGKNPGYDVRDEEGGLWAVKLGEEAQSEVTASRLLWAVGFHQPPVYYVPGWQLAGADAGADAGEQPAGRFRAELPRQDVIGEWSWYDNPFIGSRPFAALVAVNLLINNWDLKTANNKIYRVRLPDGTVERRYVVRDLGASFGQASQPRLLSWFPFMRHMQGTKNDVDDFESQGFVEAIDGDAVTFDYRGLDSALVDSVTAADLRWTAAQLSRLSDAQWDDAFRAGGYTPETRQRFIRKIQQKLAEVGVRDR